MSKRKRKPGGGRKPGPLGPLSAPKSVRMPQDLRDQLERAARQNELSFNSELVNRLKHSFKPPKSDDPAMRAFSYLFSKLGEQIYSLDWTPDWRSDPWTFEAFRLAVSKLLDRFQPAGKIELPDFWQMLREIASNTEEAAKLDKGVTARRTESPEAMADYAVEKVWSDFTDPLQARRLYEGWKSSSGKVHPTLGYWIDEWGSTSYNMTRARQDLAPKHKSRGVKS